jgi:pyruvate kinase
MVAVRELCKAWGRVVPLVAKVETPPAVEDIDEIVKASDVIMVARGDLGVEFSPEAVPVLQRKLIAVSHRHRRPVIVATEMLQSMVDATRPTRAEASDVANAVFGDADAVMLSAETATGAHPALAVEMMSRIVVEAERAWLGEHSRPGTGYRDSVEESIAFNAADIADEIHAKALVAYTFSGTTARLVSNARPDVPLFVFSISDAICRRTALYWGVRSQQVEVLKDQEEMVQHANGFLLKSGAVKPGEYFVVVFGAPVGPDSSTNSIRVRAAG